MILFCQPHEGAAIRSHIALSSIYEIFANIMLIARVWFSPHDTRIWTAHYYMACKSTRIPLLYIKTVSMGQLSLQLWCNNVCNRKGDCEFDHLPLRRENVCAAECGAGFFAGHCWTTDEFAWSDTFQNLPDHHILHSCHVESANPNENRRTYLIRGNFHQT